MALGDIGHLRQRFARQATARAQKLETLSE
jgi:hypothetical protein